jgi:hypothetical protein
MKLEPGDVINMAGTVVVYDNPTRTILRRERRQEMSAGKAKPQAKAKSAARGEAPAAKKCGRLPRAGGQEESALHAKLAKELKA